MKNTSDSNSNSNYRTLNRDGSDNIDRSTLKKSLRDLYHQLLSASWTKFFYHTLFVYLLLNLAFSIIYFILGPDGFLGLQYTSGLKFFEECFFFSIQTFSTIGYGRVSPVSFFHNIVVSIEAFWGMLSIAIMSGLLFARFSRPTSKIKFSDIALITQHRGKRCLIFRVANARLNQIVEASVSAGVLLNHEDEHGRMRLQYDLTLLRNKSLFFAASWVIAHVIDENSPLFNKSIEDLKNLNAEIILSFIGLDDTFSQTIHSRFSYIWNEIVFDRQFADILERHGDKFTVNIAKISELK